jgi:hypothetical protein
MEMIAVKHETFEIVPIKSQEVRFHYDGENLTFTDSDGIFYPCVSLRRCFPLSAEDTNILARVPDTEDSRGHEIGIIEDVEELETGSREAVLRELSLYYFVPQIERIWSIREEFGFLYWSVETNRGRKDFIMRDSITSSVRKVSEGRWLIIDINQTRYEVHHYNSLDSHSQKLLRRYLLL